jgi:hypothetical protein
LWAGVECCPECGWECATFKSGELSIPDLTLESAYGGGGTKLDKFYAIMHPDAYDALMRIGEVAREMTNSNLLHFDGTDASTTTTYSAPSNDAYEPSTTSNIDYGREYTIYNYTRLSSSSAWNQTYDWISSPIRITGADDG